MLTITTSMQLYDYSKELKPCCVEVKVINNLILKYQSIQVFLIYTPNVYLELFKEKGFSDELRYTDQIFI